jgi:hypothetical protein
MIVRVETLNGFHTLICPDPDCAEPNFAQDIQYNAILRCPTASSNHYWLIVCLLARRTLGNPQSGKNGFYSLASKKDLEC